MGQHPRLEVVSRPFRRRGKVERWRHISARAKGRRPVYDHCGGGRRSFLPPRYFLGSTGSRGWDSEEVENRCRRDCSSSAKAGRIRKRGSAETDRRRKSSRSTDSGEIRGWSAWDPCIPGYDVCSACVDGGSCRDRTCLRRLDRGSSSCPFRDFPAPSGPSRSSR